MQTIIEMVNHTRLDCVLGSAALHAPRGGRGDAPRRAPARVRRAARRAAADAERARRPLPRVRGRDADGAAPGAGVRRAATTPFRRLATAVAKYWVCKRAPRARRPRRSSASAATATSRSRGLPRLYRESPLNSIWEGSGNVQLPRRAAGASRARPRASTPSSPRSARGRRRARPCARRVEREVEQLDESRRALPRRAARARAPGLAAAPARRPRRRRGVLRDASRRWGRPRLRHAAARARPWRRSSSGTGRSPASPEACV